MKLLRLVGVAAFVLGLAFASQASANSIQIEINAVGTPKNSSSGPYQLLVDNSRLITATCFREDQGVGQPWTAWLVPAYDKAALDAYNATYLAGEKAYTQDLLQQVEWLTKQFDASGSNWGEVHKAIWALYPGTGGSLDGDAKTYYDNARLSDNYGNIGLGTFYAILPVNPKDRQPFVTDTPEPASLGLILMGSGLCAVVGWRRRKA